MTIQSLVVTSPFLGEMLLKCLITGNSISMTRNDVSVILRIHIIILLLSLYWDARREIE